MTYRSGIHFQRTAEEYKDMHLSWARSDEAFFAHGACHILAHQFIELHEGEGFELIKIRPEVNHLGNHIFASNGTWAFDSQGWTLEEELINTHGADYSEKYPGWGCELFTIREGLQAHIAAGNSGLRPPEYWPELPWRRAYRFIKRFPSTPPAGE